MKKRIVFTVTNDLVGDQRMHRIASALAGAGYDIRLIGRNSTRIFPHDYLGFHTTRLKCFFSRGKVFYIEYNLRLFWKLLFAKADIFGAVDLDTILPVLFVSKLRGIKWTYDAHEYFTEVPEVHERRMIKAFWLRVEQLAIPRANACYTVSVSLARLFQEKYKVPFSVVRNLAMQKTAPRILGAERYILYQGALNRGRGLEALIEAMESIPCKLKIAGKGDVELALKRLVIDLKLEEKVEFLGFLRPKDLEYITAGAFLGYNVLENDGKSYYYSLANKTFDYMQAGVPVLCSSFPEYKTLSGEHPFILFAEAESVSIASAIRLLLESPEMYSELSTAALEASKTLNWEAEQVKLLDIYDGLSNLAKKEVDR